MPSQWPQKQRKQGGQNLQSVPELPAEMWDTIIYSSFLEDNRNGHSRYRPWSRGKVDYRVFSLGQVFLALFGFSNLLV